MSVDKPGTHASASCPFAMIAIDLDGTLVDTVADLHAATICMQRLMGIQLSAVDDVRSWVGNGIETLVHRALTHSMHGTAEPTRFDQGLRQFKVAYERLNASASALYPGVRSGLDWLAGLGVPLICVTNKAGCFSRPLLEAHGISSCFAHHIAGDEVSAKKPDPAALLEAARRSKVSAAACLLIGDSVSDIRAARAAAFTMICVSYGYNHGRAVRDLDGELRPDAVIDSFAQLPETFSRLSSR